LIATLFILSILALTKKFIKDYLYSSFGVGGTLSGPLAGSFYKAAER
jgi:hypothetical protein